MEAVVVLAQSLGLLSVATGEGGTPLSGFPDSWWTADPCVPQHLVVHARYLAASEGHSLSHTQCIMSDHVPSVTAAPCPTLSLLCYEASALGASFCPFFRDGESDVFTVFRGGLTGSLVSSCNDGSLYIATVVQKEKLGYQNLMTDWFEFCKKCHKGHKPSITLGRKCAAPLVFFTRLPFMIWPSRLIPIYQQRPDWVWR